MRAHALIIVLLAVVVSIGLAGAGGDFAEASRLLTSAMVDWRQAVAAPAPVGR